MLELLMALSLTSPVFTHQGAIPKNYTCQGKDISPALKWSGLPDGTKSLALIIDDPDAPDPEAPTARLGSLGAVQHPREREWHAGGGDRDHAAAGNARRHE